MTEKLYYHDAKLRKFTAKIKAHQDTKDGPAVQLDRTAFYPTGGGQSHDTGTIAGIPVLDVWSDADGEVWHLLKSMPKVETVEGEIDWSRRFDHMQLHTGQHLLSAAFTQELNAPTLACHLGSENSTIDLGITNLSWETAGQVENAVNRAIWENRKITTEFVTDEMLAHIELRREPKVEGPIRIVSVEGYDATPCGGTHTDYTGEVGLVKITGIENYKGNVRISFLCGEQALKDYRRALQILQGLSKNLTTGQDEVLEVINRLQEENKEVRHALKKAEGALRDLEAEHLWEEAPVIDGKKQLVAYWPERSFKEIQTIAARFCEHPKTVILAATENKGTIRLVCARSKDLPAIDASAILRKVTGPLGGKGGGSPAMAQGGSPSASPEVIHAALEKALTA